MIKNGFIFSKCIISIYLNHYANIMAGISNTMAGHNNGNNHLPFFIFGNKRAAELSCSFNLKLKK